MPKPNGRVAPRALPDSPPSSEGGIADVIRSMLPERSADDRAAGVVRMRLGDRDIALGVLPIKPNREWKARFNDELMSTMSGLDDQANVQSVIGFLSGMTDTQLALLQAYDSAKALPAISWIEEHATESQLLTALLGVTAAAFPLVDAALQVLLESPDIRAALVSGFQSMSSSQPNTDGAPTRLKTG